MYLALRKTLKFIIKNFKYKKKHEPNEFFLAKLHVEWLFNIYSCIKSKYVTFKKHNWK